MKQTHKRYHLNLNLSTEDYVIPATPCPNCNCQLDRAKGVTNGGWEFKSPSSGDYTVCFNCCCWLVYRDNMSVRFICADDILNMNSETHHTLRAVTHAIKMTKDHQ